MTDPTVDRIWKEWPMSFGKVLAMVAFLFALLAMIGVGANVPLMGLAVLILAVAVLVS